ncbi:F-box/FBD/LRR-repeat protein At1g13570-like isoform X7 [Helianthus annuus]|uniref:F-box/FBD/LRR-repeat protein At1g13570-like isoform X7 n=1 Tax=Helianthus annuus TaxID=4232 RepID=UPI001652EAE0|nr:F-box/FBD/LRR-repeat protein At1g13570-like isoform X7 [Helianthus annuus]
MYLFVRIMGLIQGTHKAPKLAPQDFISSMPDIVINNILDRLPFRNAVRTSVLSSNWRFKWTMLTQLVLDVDFFDSLEAVDEDEEDEEEDEDEEDEEEDEDEEDEEEVDDDESNNESIVSKLLLQLRGPITKFELSVDDISDADDMDNWILFLSRRGLKDLTLTSWNADPLDLPTRLFSCVELKHLKLRNCFFCLPPTFHGFPNLLSLDLCVEFEDDIQLGEFFTRCPLLEKLTMDDQFEMERVNIVEIAKQENLKILSLKFHDSDDEFTITNSSDIFELVGSLPKLQELHLDFEDSDLIEGGPRKSFFTAFPCLKTLEITQSYGNADSPLQGDYSTTRLLQLQSVMFDCLKGSENEIRLIKYLLACSPSLKRMHIFSCHFSSSEEKLVFVRKLLKLYRASPVVELELFWH